MNRRIFDCFLFNAELDLLEFRLDLLDGVVDHHVVVEAPRTYSGAAKPLHYGENRDRFERHADRIIHIVVDDLPLPDPGENGRWVPENFQRRAIARGLTDAGGDDLLLLCDVDEVPDPAVLAAVADDITGPVALEMSLAFLRANWLSRASWRDAKLAPIGTFADPQALRLASPALLVREAGAHFSYLMGESEVRDKLRTYAHDEFDVPMFTDPNFLRACIAGRIFPLTNEALIVQSPADLGAVPRALLAARPELFEFGGLPAPVVRRILGSYLGHRQSSRLPAPARRALDAAFARSVGGSEPDRVPSRP